MTVLNFYEQQVNESVAFFVSDIHIRPEYPVDVSKLESFVDYLIKEKSKAQIFFLGDIFDFWFCQASPVKKKTESLLTKLSYYNKNHGRVVFFEGNHDIHLSYSLTHVYGIDVVPDRCIISLKNKKIILEHGDLFNPNDKNYLLLRKFLRLPFLKFSGRYLVPSAITAQIGSFFSSKSSKFHKIRSETVSDEIKRKFIDYAKIQLEQEDADVFIAGHTHERLMHLDEDGLIVNTGSWFDHKWILSFSDESDRFQFLSL